MRQKTKIELIKRIKDAGIPFELATINQRDKPIIRIKSVVIFLLYWYEGLTQNEIADLLNTTQSSVCKLISAHHPRLFNDPEYKEISEEAKENYLKILKEIQLKSKDLSLKSKD